MILLLLSVLFGDKCIQIYMHNFLINAEILTCQHPVSICLCVCAVYLSLCQVQANLRWHILVRHTHTHTHTRSNSKAKKQVKVEVIKQIKQKQCKFLGQNDALSPIWTFGRTTL